MVKYRIYDETGFWKGPEGEWRFEIDDTDIKFKPEALKSFEEIMQQELLTAGPFTGSKNCNGSDMQ